MRSREVVLGTGSSAKLEIIMDMFRGSSIMLVGLGDNKLGSTEQPEEKGKTPGENARIKALWYVSFSEKPVLAVDTAIEIEGLPDELQPGVLVNRAVGGKRSSDEQLVAYYSQLIESQIGEKATMVVCDGICLVVPGRGLFCDEIESRRPVAAKPSKKILPGRPLDSLTIDPVSGKYVSEMTKEESQVYWRREVGDRLVRFVEEHLGSLV